MSLQQHRLSNGFRIVTEHMPGLASASIGVWVSAGARHETATQNGIAHFLEHMAFKGTAKRTSERRISAPFSKISRTGLGGVRLSRRLYCALSEINLS